MLWKHTVKSWVKVPGGRGAHKYIVGSNAVCIVWQALCWRRMLSAWLTAHRRAAACPRLPTALMIYLVQQPCNCRSNLFSTAPVIKYLLFDTNYVISSQIPFWLINSLFIDRLQSELTALPFGHIYEIGHLWWRPLPSSGHHSAVMLVK